MSITSKPAATRTYAETYNQLEAIANRLKSASGATSIDSLVDDVRSAREAYGFLRARLSTVRHEIDAEIAAAQDSADPDAGLSGT